MRNSTTNPALTISWDDAVMTCGIPMSYREQLGLCMAVAKAMLEQYTGTERGQHVGNAITALADGMLGKRNRQPKGTINWWTHRAGSCAKNLPSVDPTDLAITA